MRARKGFHARQAPGVTGRVLVGGARPGTASDAPAGASTVAAAGAPSGRESAQAPGTRLAAEGMDIRIQAFLHPSPGQLFATSLRPVMQPITM
ncbi:hypothetical protein CCO03_19045 [Comamonas serinivorans]|uniref:Uncharacterized protein n=2 Tax=Comamonas serinivorans TaxID=1082851 RepID=A0A1Y0ES46_9BURK|nr:hypothetical protein CCO03_19045 [Comamonas serinivorans]